MSRLILSFTVATLLGACATTSQYTSGQDYLAKYDHVAYQSYSDIDAEIKQIAAIEPRLEFPARIGLARIQRGQLTSVPADEIQSWQDMTHDLGASYGEFVPVSPLIAAMVSRDNKTHNRANKVVDDIRRGSARQHLDYVLIYEVSEKEDAKTNALRFADLTILGLYVLPTRNIKVEAAASAMLIDVRNGYPYGTATAYADEESLSTFVGKGDKFDHLSDKARANAVDSLTDEVLIFMEELKVKSSTQYAELN